MASLFCKTGGNLSTLTYQKVVASSLPTSYGYSDSDLLTTAKYLEFTADEAGDMEGAVVILNSKQNSGTGTVTVTLQENTGSWVDRATCTLKDTDIQPNTPYEYYGTCLSTYFEFDTPYAITTDASTWRIKVVSDVAYYWHKSPYGAAIVLTDSATYTSGDDVWFGIDCTIVQDESKTFGNFIQGNDFKWTVPSTVASSLTLTINGIMLCTKRMEMRFGEDADNRIPYDNKYTLNINKLEAGASYGSSAERIFTFWGEKPTDYFAMLDGDSDSGQNIINTKTDMSGSWVAGDILMIGGSEYTASGGYYAEIDSIDGTEITLVDNLVKNHMDDWEVINHTRAIKCGIEINTAISYANGYDGWAEIAFSGVLLDFEINTYWQFSNWYSNAEEARCKPCYVDTLIAINGTSGIMFSPRQYSTTTQKGGYYKNVFVYGAASDNHNGHSGIIYANGVDIYNIYGIGGTTAGEANIQNNVFNLSGLVSCTIKDVRVGGTYATAYTPLVLDLTNTTVDNLKSYGGKNPVYLNSLINTTFTDCEFSGGTYAPSGKTVQFNGTVIGTTFKNCKFGREDIDVDTLFGLTSGVLQQIITNNCEFNTSHTTIIDSLELSLAGSYVKNHNYDKVTDSHNAKFVTGNTQSAGDDLTDTTIHTSGIDKFSIRFEPLSSADNLEWEFNVPTGNIQNKTMTVAVWIKINSADYYAGTHQLPRLYIDYDDGTEIYCQSSEDTDWQLLYVTFTPTTIYGQITVKISGKTDATGSDAYFYVDDFSVLYPAGYKLDLGGLDNWANAMPVTPPIATVLSANDVWTAVDTADYGDNTIGNRVKKLKNPSILIDGEIIT